MSSDSIPFSMELCFYGYLGIFKSQTIMSTIQEQARRLADLHVLWGQSSVIDELIQAGRIDEEFIYPFNGEEVLEWWLVTPWLADRLREQGETVIDELGSHWWGRTSSGQAIYMDHVIEQICEDN